MKQHSLLVQINELLVQFVSELKGAQSLLFTVPAVASEDVLTMRMTRLALVDLDSENSNLQRIDGVRSDGHGHVQHPLRRWQRIGAERNGAGGDPFGGSCRGDEPFVRWFAI